MVRGRAWVALATVVRTRTVRIRWLVIVVINVLRYLIYLSTIIKQIEERIVISICIKSRPYFGDCSSCLTIRLELSQCLSNYLQNLT